MKEQQKLREGWSDESKDSHKKYAAGVRDDIKQGMMAESHQRQLGNVTCS